MRLEVRLFGGLTERVGASRLSVEVAEPASVGALRAALATQHAALAPLLPRVSVAVDLAVADDDQPLTSTAEVALLPPVAGGAGADADPTAPGPAGAGPTPCVRADGRRSLTGLRPPPLSLDAAVEAVSSPRAGGIASFVGRVRDHAPDLAVPVARLDYIAYPAMAEQVLADIADEMLDERPQVLGVALLHAVGELVVAEPTLLIACAAAHRGPALDACREALERTKRRVPVFKREVAADGSHRWVGLDGGDGPGGAGGGDHHGQGDQRDAHGGDAQQAHEADPHG